MLLRKNFENLQTAMVILVLFEQFLRKVCQVFGPYSFECFTKYDSFGLHSFDFACLRRLRHIVTKRFKIMEKFYSSKTLSK